MADSRLTRPKRFVIACGGTGGHLFPGISVAEELRRRGHEILLLVSEKAIDQRALHAHPHLDSRHIPIIGMPRPLSFAMLGFLLKLWKAYRHCQKILRQFQPHAVLGMGGFTSLPPVMAGRKMGRPTYIHESNAIPGKANRLAAKRCCAVFLGMGECARHFPKETCHLVGTPIRDGLREAVDRRAARASFGLEPDKFTMLVMGGSQGARALNHAACQALDHLDPKAIQLLHLTGIHDLAQVRAIYESSHFTHYVTAFCDRMAEALASADASLCRSGASSMGELAHFGIPGILVPYPLAAEDHQTHNARPFAEAGAAVLCRQRDLTGAKLAEIIRGKFLVDAERQTMGKKMRSFSSNDANIKICDIMEAQTTA